MAERTGINMSIRLIDIAGLSDDSIVAFGAGRTSPKGGRGKKGKGKGKGRGKGKGGARRPKGRTTAKRRGRR
ncbi:MAG: hypothetical protein EBU84_15965 [Actinobacteria bacterium]|nr:hypothetical protein [Actinomycetota bacterium]